jgi:protein arginine N-methyltransferase 3
LSRDEKVDLLRFDDDEYKRPVEPKSDSGLVSFTTGPRGKETHWRQVAFLLREPITLLPGAR